MSAAPCLNQASLSAGHIPSVQAPKCNTAISQRPRSQPVIQTGCGGRIYKLIANTSIVAVKCCLLDIWRPLCEDQHPPTRPVQVASRSTGICLPPCLNIYIPPLPEFEVALQIQINNDKKYHKTTHVLLPPNSVFIIVHPIIPFKKGVCMTGRGAAFHTISPWHDSESGSLCH